MTSLGTLGGEGGSSFPFDKVGDFVVGTVLSMEQRPQTEMDGPNKGQPTFWPDGKPKTMFTVALQTDAREVEGDDGVRTVHLKGSTKPESQSSLAAVRQAVKGATGSYDLQYGAKLTLQFSGEEAAAQRGISPRKLYSAWYELPPMGLGDGPVAPPVAAAPPTVPQSGPPVAPPAPAPSAPPVAPPAVQAQPAPGSAPSAPAPSVPAGITPEQLAAMQAASAPAAAWDSDPRVPQLRAMGIADDAIRSTLGI